MKLKLDYANMMEPIVGERGLDDGCFKADAVFVAEAHSSVMKNRGKGWLEWCSLPFAGEAEIGRIERLGQRISEKAQSLVVLGIGGSALGARAVTGALLHLRHNELGKEVTGLPRLYIEDNVDPERMSALLDVIDMGETYFNVITKSGETSETLSQFMVVYARLKEKLGSKARERVIVTTTEGRGALYEIAQREGFEILGVGRGVGGRFSVLSAVGLLPFAAVGIDIRALLAGARAASAHAENPEMSSDIPLTAAYLNYKAMRRGMNICVMLPYADSLKYMADFFAQLWAESLGKALDRAGRVINSGQTPVKALGVTDQHSQIQLYTEGPFDKLVTFLRIERFRCDVAIPSHAPGPDFLQGKSLGKLMNAECKATAFALTKAGRSNYSLIMPDVNAETVGELLTVFMYQTAFAGEMLGIDAFNQPGVEEGKKAAFAMMGRLGYEEKLREIEDAQCPLYKI